MFMKKIMKMIIIKKMFLFNMFIEIAFISAFVITAGATIFESFMYILQVLPQVKFSGSFVIIFNPLVHSFNMLSHTSLLVNASSHSAHSYLGPSCVFSVWFTGPRFLLSLCWQIQHSNKTPLCFTNICLSKFDFIANLN